MSTVVSVEEQLVVSGANGNGNGDGNGSARTRTRTRTVAVCKGAPEVLEPLLAHCPPWYRRCHRHYTLKGCRVLALAWRDLGSSSGAAADDARAATTMPRAEVEAGLRFAGFLMFQCHLKKDSKAVVKQVSGGGRSLCVDVTEGWREEVMDGRCVVQALREGWRKGWESWMFG
jgi:magnesium-transporting ATPase (P-type)